VLLDAQDHLAIEQLKSKLTAAIGASDVPAIGGLYTDDAILLAPRRAIVGSVARARVRYAAWPWVTALRIGGWEPRCRRY